MAKKKVRKAAGGGRTRSKAASRKTASSSRTRKSTTGRRGKTTAARATKTGARRATKASKGVKKSTAKRKSAQVGSSRISERSVNGLPAFRTRRTDASEVTRAPAMPRPGMPAPDFELQDETSAVHSLADYRGRTLVLYFYPKDDTPGCTMQACGFRDQHNEYRQRDISVLGISPDDVWSHRQFVDKHRLPFPLLSDPEHRIAEKYGVWGERNMYGKRVMGILRTTFIIDPDGRIAHVFERVRPEGHENAVLQWIDDHLGRQERDGSGW